MDLELLVCSHSIMFCRGRVCELSVLCREFVKLDESSELSILIWKCAGLDGL